MLVLAHSLESGHNGVYMIELKNAPSDSFQQKLFDPVQTHAVYRLTDETLPAVKEELKQKGATRFRVVKCHKPSPWRILCYKSPIKG